MHRFVWMIVCMALVSCGRAASPAIARATHTVNGITIVLESHPRPVMAMPQTWTVILTDAAGTPIDGADVYLDLIMPGMPMGQQKPLALPAGSGRYVATGAYTMDETWEVIVHAEIDRVDYPASFLIPVYPQEPR